MTDNPSHRDDVAEGDDLTRISGIGSRIAERLYTAGIATYADLASRSADDIAKLLPEVSGLSTARLDGWRDRARELAAVASVAGPRAQAVPEDPAEALSNGQHYESFLVRVLLNVDGSVRRVTAQHITTGGAERHWPGLERDALADFITAALSVPVPPSSDQARSAGPEDHGTSSAVLSTECTMLRAAEPFTMTVTIELAAPASRAERLAYSAVIVARPMAGGPKRTLAQAEGLLATALPTVIIDAAGLPPGAYRLDGAVSLREPGSEHPVDLAAIAEGLLVQVLPG